jgi:mono/diheme cytochrome c family protein
MMDFVYFLGRFHVLVLHLPLGILTLAVAMEVLVSFKPFKFLEPAVGPVWAAGALSALGTATLGLMHATESSFQDLPAVDAHRAAGLTLTATACVIAVLRLRLGPIGEAGWPKWAPARLEPLYRKAWPTFARGALVDRIYARIWPVAAGLMAVMLIVTGHLGGSLTHGDTYLVEYAPAPIRWLAGLPEESAPRDKPKDLASADIYLDVVAPAFRQRCSSCHNQSKRSGRLSLATYAQVMKGGKDGPVILPGDPAKSELLRRISLSDGDKDFMPKGKTPLTAQQIAAIGWWISQGAPQRATVASLKMKPGVQAALQQILGFGGALADDDEGGPRLSPDDENYALPAVPAADPAAIAALNGAGFIVRPVAKSSNLVDVDFTLHRPLTDADMAALDRIAPQVLRLDLRGTGLIDGQMKAIGALPNLRRLRLEDNAITDAGLASIDGLKSLRHLNLVNTKITDRGLAALGGLDSLKAVYVWQTGVTDAGAQAFRTAHAKVSVNVGVKPSEVVKETTIMQPR